MNGELMNMLQLTLTAKHYIGTGEFAKSLTENSKIGSYSFRFAEQSFSEDAAAFEVGTREEWLAELKRRGAQDFKFIMPDEIDDFSDLAYVNKIPCCIICFYDGGVTTWNKVWRFNAMTEKWHVQLVESVLEDAPDEKPRFGDVSQDMVTVLERIRALAQKLGLSDFSFQFHVAQKSLQANFVNADEMMQPAHRRLLQAAIDAYVFGGEGSWNDKGKAAAENKGLTAEYESLTKELYRGIAYSCMYAVNEI